jgi:hypothetical protein
MPTAAIVAKNMEANIPLAYSRALRPDSEILP